MQLYKWALRANRSLSASIIFRRLKGRVKTLLRSENQIASTEVKTRYHHRTHPVSQHAGRKRILMICLTWHAEPPVFDLDKFVDFACIDHAHEVKRLNIVHYDVVMLFGPNTLEMVSDFECVARFVRQSDPTIQITLLEHGDSARYSEKVRLSLYDSIVRLPAGRSHLTSSITSLLVGYRKPKLKHRECRLTHEKMAAETAIFILGSEISLSEEGAFGGRILPLNLIKTPLFFGRMLRMS